jgi:pimeloyl-ACP methyl ester carboxylesterase
VTVPTLVIHGLVDTLVRPSGGIATAKAIPGARLLMFNDMGHDLPGTRYLDIAEAIASVAARAQSVVRL